MSESNKLKSELIVIYQILNFFPQLLNFHLWTGKASKIDEEYVDDMKRTIQPLHY